MTSLRKSIGRILAIGALLCGARAEANWIPAPSAWEASPFDTTGTSDLPPVDAIPPLPDPDPEPINPIGGGDGDGGDNGGNNGGEGQNPQPPRCAELLASRPQSCPNPVRIPAGPYYGEESIPGSTVLHRSSIRMAIGFAKKNAPWNGVTIEPHESSRSFLEAALQEQTENFAAGMSLAEANNRFRIHLGLACQMQADAANANRNSITPTKPEEFCFEMLKSFDAEANDEKNFFAWFIDYSNRTGIPLDDYVPYGIVGMEDTKNSIGEKWRKVTEDATCSRWWTEVQANSCGVQ